MRRPARDGAGRAERRGAAADGVAARRGGGAGGARAARAAAPRPAHRAHRAAAVGHAAGQALTAHRHTAHTYTYLLVLPNRVYFIMLPMAQAHDWLMNTCFAMFQGE